MPSSACNPTISFAFLLVFFAAVSLYVNQLHLQDLPTVKHAHLQSFLTDGNAQQDDDVETATEYTASNFSLAGLSCERWGGPSDEASQEMVYWSDIPEDNRHISPFYRPNQFLTFEPDNGGWNNIRMAMETVLALAFAMGRTLVLPPEKEFYLLTAKHHQGQQQRKHFSFAHFFNMRAIHEEHAGLSIISMSEFLSEHVMKGQFVDRATGQATFPPGNRTEWDGVPPAEMDELFRWLRKVAHVAPWNPEKCLAAFPTERDNDTNLRELELKMKNNPPHWEDYVDNPVPVDAPAVDRLAENWAERDSLCIYDTEMQHSPLVHFSGDHKLGARLLVHFYAFLFMEDWKQDLWGKRFIRDHVRYIDSIQCAAARVVQAIRHRVRSKESSEGGEFDSFHIRRGDFQYKKTRVEASQILQQAQKKIKDGATVYIATDERDKSYFKPLMEHFDVVFLDDFMDELQGINSNYFGMIDQLVASRGRVFFGCWFSTFSSYIMRLRGYHENKRKLPGYDHGISNSWYYVLEDRFDHMQHYYPVKKVFYAREFPTSWRLIDFHTGVP
ncbi:hypothetical protein FisN_10Hh195 [Fistulifera solaris]|uniref:O-fucosyltransferase family protein n=1 Tax=Fistulifera solaris TaxID=1519565 RepID=A0A1Z5JXP3_FISSO|nr:hypothetical protein FisN_10Hh195 [Fistulifera solaris]|eukprot:GAX18598.1 hypothetical protein FisN_10Hh195 [Fistulifera solaris]